MQTAGHCLLGGAELIMICDRFGALTNSAHGSNMIDIGRDLKWKEIFNEWS
jgi:hypothetical protein